jgi:hypothetical protein
MCLSNSGCPFAMRHCTTEGPPRWTEYGRLIACHLY